MITIQTSYTGRTLSPEEILQEAEQQCGVMSLARDRAACGRWPQPETPGDYLMWIEDEAQLQEDNLTTIPEYREHLIYVLLLHSYAITLRIFGVKASIPPWDLLKQVAL